MKFLNNKNLFFREKTIDKTALSLFFLYVFVFIVVAQDKKNIPQLSIVSSMATLALAPTALPADTSKPEPAKAEFSKSKTSMSFHSGTILSAELCKYNFKKIIITNPIKTREIDTPENLAFAAVTVTVDDGRSIGVYDYVLKNSKGQEFPCIALRSNDGAFDGSPSTLEIKNIAENERITLLFVVKMPSGFETPVYYLKFKLYDDKQEPKPLEFKYIGDNEFTLPTTIPQEGVLLKVQ